MKKCGMAVKIGVKYKSKQLVHFKGITVCIICIYIYKKNQRGKDPDNLFLNVIILYINDA